MKPSGSDKWTLTAIACTSKRQSSLLVNFVDLNKFQVNQLIRWKWGKLIKLIEINASTHYKPNFIRTSETSSWGVKSGSGTFQWLVTTEVVFKFTLCVCNLRRNFPFETQKHKEPVCDKNHVQFLQAYFASFVKLTRFLTKGHLHRCYTPYSH